MSRASSTEDGRGKISLSGKDKGMEAGSYQKKRRGVRGKGGSILQPEE